jgi:hypothetical protein
MMLAIDQIEEAVEGLAEIRQAIIAMKPSKSEADRLNRIYNAILKAEQELNQLKAVDNE